VIGAPSWEQVEAAAQQFQRKAADGRFAPAPNVYNAEAPRWLTGIRELGWDGRQYLVQPVPFEAGAQLYRVHLRLAKLYQERHARQEQHGGDGLRMDLEAEEEAAQEEVQLVREAVALMGTLVRPQGGMMRRLLARLGLLRNPFRSATAGEVVELLDFFYSSPTASRVLASRAQTFERSRRG
jgi:hypothetical protein